MNRSAGILLHPTSLPSAFGIGDLGESAFKWAEMLHQNGQSFWQVCPLGPTGYGDSPYQCFSSFAGNPLLISPIKLMEEGLLTREEIDAFPVLPRGRMDYQAVGQAKEALFRKAFGRFGGSEEFSAFCETEKYWLDDYALFRVIKKKNGERSWTEWDSSLKVFDREALGMVRRLERDEIRYHAFLQFVFFRQWAAVKTFANEMGIQIIGDVPIYTAFDSADTWSFPRFFELDEDLNPQRVAGVPPDYFSETGQLWGNPLYRWDRMREDGFQWWISRIKKTLELVDIIRLDHFRGFDSYWAVPAGRPDAIVGEWMAGPGIDLFDSLRKALGSLPLIAEDLGDITPKVIALRKAVGIPGMKVLQFAFNGNPANWHLPYNLDRDIIIYTGTHDNDTTLGWFDHLGDKEKKYVIDYLACDPVRVVENMVRAAYSSPASWCIIPMQDLLQLDSSHRMNIPGTLGGNWQWRCTEAMMKEAEREMHVLHEFSRIYGRLPGQDGTPSMDKPIGDGGLLHDAD